MRNVNRICNAITEACREMQRCPDDSVQDIVNESLESWETGLRMDHNFNIDPNAGRDASTYRHGNPEVRRQSERRLAGIPNAAMTHAELCKLQCPVSQDESHKSSNKPKPKTKITIEFTENGKKYKWIQGTTKLQCFKCAFSGAAECKTGMFSGHNCCALDDTFGSKTSKTNGYFVEEAKP